MSTVKSYPEVTVRDKCHDRDDAGGILVVLERTGTEAAEYELAGGITVADVYPEYPRDDTVVVCAYQRALESGDADRLYYPEGKLDVYAAGNYTEHEGGVDCEHCGETVGTTTAWVEHVVRECQETRK